MLSLFLIFSYLFYLLPLVVTIGIRFFIACFLRGWKQSKLFSYGLEYGLLILPILCWFFAIINRQKSISNIVVEPFLTGITVSVIFMIGLLVRKYSLETSAKVVVLVQLILSCLAAILIAVFTPMLPE